MIIGIDHIQLAMPNGGENRARAFFAKVLGMEEIAKPSSLNGRGGVWFECGAQALHLGVEANFKPAKKAHPAFLVKSLSYIEVQLRQHQVQISYPPALPNATRLFIEDPFGNRIELIQR